MPIYEFHCPTCDHGFEELLSIRQFHDHDVACPLCQGSVEHVMGAPMPINTGRAWLSQHGSLLDQFGDTPSGRANLAARIKAAKRRGLTPSRNSVYDPTLADSPGDPAAFIPHDDPVGHARRLLTRRRLGSQGGLVTMPTPAPAGPPPRIPLAEDIVERRTNERIKKDPGLASKRAEVREQVIERHAYRRSSA